jgi:hypothetical protein
MAEQFLSKLTKIEEKIDGLGETLKRMVTILSEVTEIKSEIRLAKDEVLDLIKNSIPASPPSAEPHENIADQMSGEFSKIQDMITGIQEQMDSKIQELIEPKFQQFQEEVRALILSAPAQATPAAVGTEASAASEAAPSISAAPVSAAKSMKIAEHLQTILGSLKMGCKAGDVLDTIAESREQITKIVESDPITVKIDKWTSEVGKTRRRKELQARDILKIKKELRKEIKKYSPA